MVAIVDYPGEAGARLSLALREPVATLTAHRLDEVADVIAAAERHARTGAWVAGFVAYEAAPAFDSALRVRAGDATLPLAWFAAFDGPTVARQAEPRGPFECGQWRMAATRDGFDGAVAAIRRAIGDGDYYQVNLSTRLRAEFSGDGEVLFESLRQAQPDAYCMALDGGAWQLLSVSPELFFDWRPDGRLTTRPMKGTAPRQADPQADAESARALRASAKEQAENLMIVDLLRNDMARVATTGSVSVPALFAVEALPTAWQMTSTVACATKSGIGLVDVFGALFPCGSVTGAPKAAAMAAIATLEDAPRGAYCGAIGLIRPGGHATFSVGIRSVAIDRKRGIAECGIGSGITFDSTSADEFAEWLVKRRFLLRATAGFELIETLRLEAGRYWLRDGHLARLSASVTHFGFAFDMARVTAALDAVAADHAAGAWRVRLQLDRSGTVRTECAALEATPDGVTVRLAESAVDEDDEFLRHKTTLRRMYACHAPPAGVFDTLLWNRRGEITEFTRGNVVVELDGRRITPPVASGLLPGVLRADMLARGEIVAAVVRKEDLARSRGIWFINSVRGVVPAGFQAATGDSLNAAGPGGAKNC